MWRHRVLSALVLVLTAAGVFRVVTSTPSVYEARASYAFINPPPPPTVEELVRDPSLATVKAGNPFTRFSDQSVIVDIVVRRLSSEQSRRRLVEAGADKRYVVAPSRRFGSSSPIAEVTGIGSTPSQARESALVVSKALTEELQNLQAFEDVDKRYMIRPLLVDGPDEARLRISSRLRPLLAVSGASSLLLYTLMSILDAVDASRAQRAARSREASVDSRASRTGRRRRDAVVAEPAGEARASEDTATTDAPIAAARREPELALRRMRHKGKSAMIKAPHHEGRGE